MIPYNLLFSLIIIIFLSIIIYLMNEIRIKENQCNLQKETINSYKEKLTQIKNDNLLLQQKAMFVEKQSDKMIEQFKSLSHETVASQSFSFIKVIEDHIHKIKTTNQEESFKNKSSIKEILTPVENTIANFEKIIQSFESKTSIDNREIFSKLSQVINTSFNLQQEVNKVINSLRSPNVKGIWGEMQLKRLVQLCGMEEHCDFQWQSTIDKGLKPDMIINLPNGKQIIVDSKVSLSAYINCMDTTDEEKKKYYLQDHARQIKQHINILNSKKYWENMENSANFVILFLPGECFLSSALEVNPSMLEYASKYNIILATPTTMIGLLKTIAFGWENIHISKDIEKIKFILQNLYGELSTVVDDMDTMGKTLDSLNKIYKKTYHTIDCNLKYPLEEIHKKYSITFQNNLKEEKVKKTKMPDSLKQEKKETINNDILEDIDQDNQNNTIKDNISEIINTLINNEKAIDNNENYENLNLINEKQNINNNDDNNHKKDDKEIQDNSSHNHTTNININKFDALNSDEFYNKNIQDPLENNNLEIINETSFDNTIINGNDLLTNFQNKIDDMVQPVENSNIDNNKLKDDNEININGIHNLNNLFQNHKNNMQVISMETNFNKNIDISEKDDSKIINYDDSITKKNNYNSKEFIDPKEPKFSKKYKEKNIIEAPFSDKNYYNNNFLIIK